jgi:hypothetical protein
MKPHSHKNIRFTFPSRSILPKAQYFAQDVPWNLSYMLIVYLYRIFYNYGEIKGGVSCKQEHS